MSNFQLNSIVQYFRSCYLADNREINIHNFLASKVEQTYFLENADLLEGHMPYHPVSENWYQKTQHQLLTYAKEKELYLASHFLTGHAVVGAKAQRIFAPLFLHPAKIIEVKDDFFVKIDITKRIFNPMFVRILKTDDADATQIYDSILEQIPEGFIDFSNNIVIREAIQQHFPKLDCNDLVLYPDVPSEEFALKRIASAARKKDGVFQVLPVQVLGVLRKSIHTLGVTNELKQIGEQEQLSKPLQQLFFPTSQGEGAAAIRNQTFAPVTLNQAQTKIFQATQQHSVSYLFGPPGTGKSFTIAALAIDHLSQGKSVLIASSNNQAVDVIADKIEQDFNLHDIVVRGGRHDYKKQLQKRLENLLSGMQHLQGDKRIIRSLEQTCSRLAQRIIKNEKRFLKLEQRELNYGQVLQQTGIVANIKQWWGKVQTNENNSIWKLLQQYQKDLTQYNRAAHRLVNERFHAQLKAVLTRDREQLQNFQRAIKARTATRKHEMFHKVDFDKLSTTFPVWLVASSEVSNVLPLKNEMFDLAIIDEATQCDIATAIPIIQRAKKIIVAGDPKQLRHISFLSQKRQRHLQETYKLQNISADKLDYRNASLLDLVSDSIQHQTQISFLNEHYRSFPHIINFSNKQFYNNALHIMHSTPAEQGQQRVFVHQTQGERQTKGHNPIEAKILVIKLLDIIAEDLNKPQYCCRTIGVLSPFREQVNHLVEMISENLDPNSIAKHKLLIGTAHTFQGEERDTMLLSFALDNKSHSTAYRHINRNDVFNVSITRAKIEQHIFTSFTIQQLKSQTLLSQYIHHVQNYTQQHKTLRNNTPQRDVFMQTILQYLHSIGYTQTYTAYPVAGIQADILVQHEQHTYCIDLIGFPGQYEAAFPIERYKMLNRVGIQVFPLSYSMWLHQQASTSKKLKSFLK